jgi:hypothetical protein
VALGSQRESLSVNPLLVHSELGKPRRRCFTLPPADFTYGMRSVCLDGGASEALSSWNVHHPTRGPLKKEPERNFIALNTRSVQCGLTTAQEQTQFRATHDIRRRDDEERKKASSAKIRFPPDMVFGISTRSPALSLAFLLSLLRSFLLLLSNFPFYHLFSLNSPGLQHQCLTFWSTAMESDGWRRGERLRENKDRKTTRRGCKVCMRPGPR